MSKIFKALLISMPWADFQFPSLQVGCLTSYSRLKGYDVEGRHLHLEAAALLSLEEYDKIVFKIFGVGDLIFAAILFPSRKKKIMAYLSKYLDDSESSFIKTARVIKKMYRSINWSKYNLVGFSINFEQLFASLLFAKWLKRDFPYIKIVFGGRHASDELGGNLLQCFPQVDWCIDGEGEIPFTKLLYYLSNNKEHREAHIPGLIFRNKGGICVNPRKQLSDLNELPDPDYDHYFDVLENHRGLVKKGIMPVITVEGSRGCPRRCAFCPDHIFWKGYRIRRPLDVANQLKRLSSKYGYNRFEFVDSGIPVRGSEELFSHVEQQGRDYHIFCESRAEANIKQLEIMRRAGVNQIQIGIESLSTKLLFKMNKGARTIDNLNVMKLCENVGIENIYNFIIKFPTESQLDIEETVNNIDFASSYRPPYLIEIFRLYYNTPVYNRNKKYGIFNIRNNMPIHRLLPSAIGKNLSWMVKAYDSNTKPRDYRQLRERIDRWRREYNQALVDNRKLLSVFDLGEVLLIEDCRHRMEGITRERENVILIALRGKERQIYLFCDSIRGWNEIKKRFPRWNRRDLKKTLNKLVKLKIMFREDDDYLSLAVRANTPRR